ncbi:hypothetical protein [Alteraurantiacibacter aquimixticola]|uniref:Uncharacterized protein n=1 Tax=Alteraurantiacibacter aquimixticola TaxID=2489173 RepID=A0A4T3F1B0_9SPHN|nr:hypothetical protein [Alteraurantiacibacter aquimixticola]TIX50744.1 hypothetical protein E5222_10905 [Alteraurantiacibacter aquimixticola]
MIALPLLLLLPAVALLRAGWGGDRRLAYAGWALGAVSLVWLGVLEGAWGVAVGFTLAIGAALVPVLYAAAVSPARARRDAKDPAIALTSDGAAIGRRLLVFLLVVPVSFLAAQWFAFTLNALMKGDAPLEANSVATAFMVQPIVWTGLMAWQMCQRGPVDMIKPPLLIAALGALLWIFA